MITPLIILSGVGLIMAALLAVGRKAFAVEVDERQEKILDILPGANCGGCGFPGCSGFAAGLVAGNANPTACPPGGADLALDIGKIMGVEVQTKEPMVALIACAGDNEKSPLRARYLGVKDCVAAHGIAGGSKACTHGCLGLGSCIETCLFDAIGRTANGLVFVYKQKCTGCAKCVEACPRGIIKMVAKRDDVQVLCVNPDKAKGVKAVCSVGCTGCKICTKQSKRFQVDGALASVSTDTPGEIPSSASLACPQGSIFDGRDYGIVPWLTDAHCRTDHEERAAAWKEEEKARKAAAKAPKPEKNRSPDDPSSGKTEDSGKAGEA